MRRAKEQYLRVEYFPDCKYLFLKGEWFSSPIFMTLHFRILSKIIIPSHMCTTKKYEGIK